MVPQSHRSPGCSRLVELDKRQIDAAIALSVIALAEERDTSVTRHVRDNAAHSIVGDLLPLPRGSHRSGRDLMPEFVIRKRARRGRGSTEIATDGHYQGVG